METSTLTMETMQIVLFAVGIIGWSIVVYVVGYSRGEQRQSERQVAEQRRAYTYSDYRAIDDKMNTNHYVDIINRAADEWSDGE
jgi:hypothetical protein